MDVLAFGSYDARLHPRITVLIEGLRAHGAAVVECNVPLRLDTAGRVRVLRQPWRLPLFLARLLTTWLSLVRRARRTPRPGIVLVGYLGHFDVLLARLLFPSATVVHDMLVFASGTAKDRGASGAVQCALRALDMAAVRASDVLVVDTEENRDQLPAGRRHDGVVVPVGAPGSWLASQPVPRPPGTPVRVVFFGLFTPLQGTPTLGRALALLANRSDIEVLVVGNGQDLSTCRELAGEDRPGVAWTSWLESDALMSAVMSADVCLGIFGTTEKAQRVVPNKVFQGAAAGCAVVTSDTPPQRRALGDAGVYVPSGDPEALAAALRALADDRPGLLAVRTAAWRLAAEQFGPRAVVVPLLHRLRHDAAAATTRKTS